MLLRKLGRDMLRQCWQVLAVVAVTLLGTGLFTASYLAYQDLRDSYHTVQVQTHLADMTLDMSSVTAGQTAQAARLPGVAIAEQQLVVDLPVAFPAHGSAPAQRTTALPTGRLLSIPLGSQPRLDQVIIVAGAYPKLPDEVVVERHFAAQFGVQPGASLQIVLPGTRISVHVVGIGVSAEYLWVARSRQDVMPSPAEFGIIFAPRPLLTRLGMAVRTMPVTSQTSSWLAPLRLAVQPDTGNRLLYDLRQGADSAQVLARVRATVGPASVFAATPRADLVGVQLLQLDVDGFQEVALLFPLLFLIVGAFIVAALLQRQVDQEQALIGTMMALGLRERAVVRHYLSVGAVIGLLGALVGSVAGIWLGNGIATVYAADLSIPTVTTHVDWRVVLTGALLGLASPILAAIAPARRAARLEPAVAMRPTPAAAGRTHPSGAPWIRHLPLWLRLPLRDIGRHPLRALTTSLGVSAALVLVVSTAGMFDSMNRGYDLTFHQAQRYDFRVDFLTPRPALTVQREVAAVPGVQRLETLVELPVQLHSQPSNQTYDTVLQGLPSPSPLLAVLDAGGHVVPPRPDAAVLSRSVAAILRVRLGDTVQVRVLPRGRHLTVRIGGLSDQLMGTALTLSSADVSRDLALGNDITTVLVAADSGRHDQVRAGLGRLSGVASVTDRQLAQAQVDDLLSLFDAFIGMMLLFGAALAAAILFNTASVGVLERRRELATMRALGERMGRLTWMVTIENGLLAIGGLIIGFPVALACLWAFLQLYSTDLFSLPFWVAPRTVILSIVGVLVVVLLSQAPALRGVARMNIAESAKARE